LETEELVLLVVAGVVRVEVEADVVLLLEVVVVVGLEVGVELAELVWVAV